VKTLALLTAIAASAFAQAPQPSVVNAQFQARAFSGDLASALRADNATWFGYAVKSRHHNTDSCCDRCRLEDSSHSSVAVYNRPIPLEGSDTIALLYRVEHGVIQKVQVHSMACPLDAGGLAFIWLTGVPAPQSIAFLAKLATTSDDFDRHEGSGIFAISMHDDPSAVTALEDLARPPHSMHLREQSMFWLAQAAGERAASFLRGAVENDPDTEVKKKAVFALSQLPKDEAVPRLIEIARENKNPEVRKQAFFWLGQTHDPRALAFFEQVLVR
jgi:HEAT repeats